MDGEVTREVKTTTRFCVGRETRDALAQLLRAVTGRAVTGEIVITLGQGGVGHVMLVEREHEKTPT